jgi:hypothetical protein
LPTWQGAGLTVRPMVMFPFAKKTPVLFSFPHQGPSLISWPSTMHRRPPRLGQADGVRYVLHRRPLTLRHVSTAHSHRRLGSPAPTAQAPRRDSPRRRASTCVDFRAMVFATGGAGFSSGLGSGQSGHTSMPGRVLALAAKQWVRLVVAPAAQMPGSPLFL